MLVSLLLKELKNNSFFSRIRKGNILSAILELCITLIYITIEIVVFSLLLNKVNKFEGADRAFLIIFLFLMTIINVVYFALKLRKLLYNDADNIILLSKPINPLINTLSKVIYIYLKNILNNFVLAVPLIVIYVNKTQFLPRFYFIALLYSLIISIFETGLAYMFSIPIYEIHKLLKKHAIIKTICSIVFIFALCIVYNFILSLFLNLVRENNILSIFSIETIDTFTKFSKFLFPTYFYVLLIEEHYIFLILLLLISFASLVIGVSIGNLVYYYNLKNNKETKIRVKQKEYKIMKPHIALLRKEVILLFDTKIMSGLSYGSLLIIQPVLTFIVVKAMETVFKSGMLVFVNSYFPYVIELFNLLFIMLFACFIYNTASFSISREKQSLRLLKSIPIDYKLQAFIKLFVPYICSLIMTFLSISVLFISGNINFLPALFTFVFLAILMLLLGEISLSSDLKRPSDDDSSSNSASIVGAVAIFIPTVTISLMFIINYIGSNTLVGFAVAIFVLFNIFIPYSIYFYKKVGKRFLALEMRN